MGLWITKSLSKGDKGVPFLLGSASTIAHFMSDLFFNLLIALALFMGIAGLILISCRSSARIISWFLVSGASMTAILRALSGFQHPVSSAMQQVPARLPLSYVLCVRVMLGELGLFLYMEISSFLLYDDNHYESI